MANELIWEDTRDVIFDETTLFNHGFDFDGWECLRQEAQTKKGRFAIWPDSLRKNSKWSMYGGIEGYLALSDFNSENEAKEYIQKTYQDCERG